MRHGATGPDHGRRAWWLPDNGGIDRLGSDRARDVRGRGNGRGVREAGFHVLPRLRTRTGSGLPAPSAPPSGSPTGVAGGGQGGAPTGVPGAGQGGAIGSVGAVDMIPAVGDGQFTVSPTVRLGAMPTRPVTVTYTSSTVFTRLSRSTASAVKVGCLSAQGRTETTPAHARRWRSP